MIIKEYEVENLACPASWYVKLDTGHLMRVVYRWGRLVVTKSYQPTRNKWDALAGQEIYDKRIGERYDGVIGWDLVEEIIKNL